MSLREVFCQDKVVSVLQRVFFADKVPGAYIFSGPDGVGRFKTAKQWTKMLLCEKPIIAGTKEERFADSCGRCRSCHQLEANSHPDFNVVYKELLEFTRDGKSKKAPIEFPIDVIREFLIEKAPIRPSLSSRKVFVVSEAEKLNVNSQNALLKILEEPPEFCFIILLCTHPERLLPTIKSRCQIIRFGPVSEEKIIEKLQESSVGVKQSRYFARLAEGSLGMACQLARLEEAEADVYRIKKELIDSIADLDYGDSLTLSAWLLEQSKNIAEVWAKLEVKTSRTDINRRAMKILVRIIISAFRDSMMVEVREQPKLVNFDQAEAIGKLAGRLGVELSAKRVADSCRTFRYIDASVNEKLIFEQLLLNPAVSDILRV